MDDTISRAKAIDALRKMQTYKLFSGDDMLLIDQAGAQTELMLLPPAQPEQLGTNLAEVGRDCISRQDAIDGKICVQRANGVEIYDDYAVPVEYLKQLPSAQPEIIRCKDCKFWTHIKRTNRYWCKTDDGLYDLNPSPNDFCSRAERRTE